MRAMDRPVLIGTRSVDKSEKLSQRLLAAGVEHQVLNARPDKHGREAEIVAQAGRRGAITIATNMAGRGTDILLGGNPGVPGLGPPQGQIRQPARRSHRRLAAHRARKSKFRKRSRRNASSSGKRAACTSSARNATKPAASTASWSAGPPARAIPGSCQFYLALDDELLEGLGADYQTQLIELGRKGGPGPWEHYLPLFRKAQRKLERRHYRQRVELMVYQKQRHEVLKELGADPYVD